MKKSLQLLNNQRGLITIDFMFASVLVGGFFAILFSLMLALSVVEITQYVTFATARNYFAAHWNIERQEEVAGKKFQELTESQVLSPFYSNGWFELKGGPGVQNWVQIYENEPKFLIEHASFHGSRIELNAKILEFRIPLIGDTTDTEDVFKANVSTYLNREPTSVECIDFMSEGSRFSAITQLDADYRNSNVRDYVRITDNGC